jgi:uncharacterized protein YneF (UPF0154 family)
VATTKSVAGKAARNSARPALTRRTIRYLHRTQPFWEQDSTRILSARYLDVQQQEVLRPLVRAWVVRYTTVRFSIMRYVEPIMNVTACAACLIGPIAIVAAVSTASTLSIGGFLLALMVYLSTFGVTAACYFEWYQSHMLAILGVLGAATCLVAAIIIGTLVAHPLKALQFGVFAGILALLVIVVGFLVGSLIGPYVWWPIRRRYLGTLPPFLATAVLLWYLADHVDDSLSTWRLAKTRHKLLLDIVGTSYWLTTRMPRAMWMAGYRGRSYSEARRRYVCAGNFVRAQTWLMIDASTRTSLEAIRNDLRDKAVAVAKGDWAVFPTTSQKRTSRSWLLTGVRRFIAALVLTGAAFLLPHLPDIRLTGSALASLQVALLVTAALSLAPIDASARESITSAFMDPRDYH